MPFIAEHEDEHITPEEADKSDELTCPKCNGELTIRQSFKRNNSFVARHFMHVSGHSSSNDGSSGCGGESDKHEKMKSVVLSKLKDLYSVKRSEYEARISTRSGWRRTDALVEFEEPKAGLGKGIAAEVQHKNESKDIAKVTSDICGAGYTVLWVEEDAIDGKDVDIQKCDIRNPFPDGVPSKKEWRPPSSLSTKEPKEFGTEARYTSRVKLRIKPSKYCDNSIKDAWRDGIEGEPWGKSVDWEAPSILERCEHMADGGVFSKVWVESRVKSEVAELYNENQFESTDVAGASGFDSGARFNVVYTEYSGVIVDSEWGGKVRLKKLNENKKLLARCRCGVAAGDVRTYISHLRTHTIGNREPTEAQIKERTRMQNVGPEARS